MKITHEATREWEPLLKKVHFPIRLLNNAFKKLYLFGCFVFWKDSTLMEFRWSINSYSQKCPSHPCYSATWFLLFLCLSQVSTICYLTNLLFNFLEFLYSLICEYIDSYVWGLLFMPHNIFWESLHIDDIKASLFVFA